MIESFFDGNQVEILETHVDPITLLSGPPCCGKTSLLFQFAYNCASQSNANVVFMCNRSRLQSKRPYLPQSIDPSSHVFKLIQMKYVEDDEEIKKYFAAFHLYDKIPTAVVVDDFGDFFDDRTCQERYANPRGRDLAMVRTLALCYNAITHANKKSPCKLLLSDTHLGNSTRLLYIYKRWISSIFTVKGDGPGSFLLRNNNYSRSCGLGKTRIAKYSIALKDLVFEGITDDNEQ